MSVRRNRPAGFTLVELMIAVAIVGILAAIAFPSYKEYVRKGHRNDGMKTLMQAAQKLEIYRSTHAQYTNDLVALGLDATSPEGYYDNLQISAGPCLVLANCYTIEIVPTNQGGQNQDTVTGYRLHSTGLKERNEGGWVEGWK